MSSLLYSKIFRSARRSGHSRGKARKMANRRRRYFVDNIIMHHKRLHDHNRKIVISSARDRAVARRKELEQGKGKEAQKKLDQKNRQEHTRWTQKPSIKAKSSEIRDRIQTKRIRAESRWAAVMQARNEG